MNSKQSKIENIYYVVMLNGKPIYIPSTFREGNGLAVFSNEETAISYRNYARSKFGLKYEVVRMECKAKINSMRNKEEELWSRIEDGTDREHYVVSENQIRMITDKIVAAFNDEKNEKEKEEEKR